MRLPSCLRSVAAVAVILVACSEQGCIIPIPEDEQAKYGRRCNDSSVCPEEAPICVTELNLCLTRQPSDLGGPCVDRLECKDGAPACIENTCQPLSARGGPCKSDADCLPDSPVCRDKLCGPPGKEGEACYQSHQCGPNAPFCVGDEDKSCAVCNPDLSSCGEDRPEGSFCIQTADCADGLFCGLSPECIAKCQLNPACYAVECGVEGTTVCQPGGTGDVLEACTTSADCKAGLTCDRIAFALRCQESGTRGPDATCAKTLDCAHGLVCVDGACTRGVTFPSIFPGGDCPNASPAPARFVFQLPREGRDFFSIPFPNDVRMTPQGILLDSFPAPEPEQLGGDVLRHYRDRVAKETRSFGPNQPVLFRYVGDLDLKGTLKLLENAYFVDVTEGDSFGRKLGSVFFFASPNKGKFICPSWLGLRPLWGAGFEPEHTYAAVVERSIKDTDGKQVVQDEDFKAMLVADAPSDSTLKTAWEAYAPLRKWLDGADNTLSSGDLAVATVFTIGTPAELMPALAEAAREAAAEPDTETEWVVCDGSAPSPCGECPAPDGPYAEVQGRLDLPIFQKGRAPYLTPDDGGALEVLAGTPTVVRTEPVCVSLTVPTAAAPAGGWPVVVYAHGTGGSFRGHVANGYAGSLSSHALGGATVSAATVGFTQVQHGERRHSELPPDILFFNYTNLLAARGNVYQGAADVLSITAWLGKGEELQLGSVPFRADPARIIFLGHSQGATTGALAVPQDPNLHAAVLSGVGGGLTLSMLYKKEPVDIPAALGVLLGETDAVNDFHPLLNMLQMYFEPVDPLNHAPLLGRDVPEGVTPKHVLVTVGSGDSYTPNVTSEAYVRRAGMPVLDPDILNFRIPAVPAPATENRSVAETKVTQVAVQYAPEGEADGHFVIFEHARARKDVLDFIATAIRDGAPTVRP